MSGWPLQEGGLLTWCEFCLLTSPPECIRHVFGRMLLNIMGVTAPMVHNVSGHDDFPPLPPLPTPLPPTYHSTHTTTHPHTPSPHNPSRSHTMSGPDNFHHPSTHPQTPPTLRTPSFCILIHSPIATLPPASLQLVSLTRPHTALLQSVGHSRCNGSRGTLRPYWQILSRYPTAKCLVEAMDAHKRDCEERSLPPANAKWLLADVLVLLPLPQLPSTPIPSIPSPSLATHLPLLPPPPPHLPLPPPPPPSPTPTFLLRPTSRSLGRGDG